RAFLYCFHAHRAHRHLHSFPTRRSSDLDTATAAPVARQGRELSRKLKELKDSLYNSDVQRDAGQDDIHYLNRFQDRLQGLGFALDRKSTRLNSSHVAISYAVFCLKKKKK